MPRVYEERGAYAGRNVGNGPLNIFCSVKILKVLRAYKSRNPALRVLFEHILTE